MEKQNPELSQLAATLVLNHQNGRHIGASQLGNTSYIEWKSLIMSLQRASSECKNIDKDRFLQRTLKKQEEEETRALLQIIGKLLCQVGCINGSALHIEWDMAAKIIAIYNHSCRVAPNKQDIEFQTEAEHYFAQLIERKIAKRRSVSNKPKEQRYQRKGTCVSNSARPEYQISSARNPSTQGVSAPVLGHQEGDTRYPKTSLLSVSLRTDKNHGSIILVADETDQNSVCGVYWVGRSISKAIITAFLFDEKAIFYHGRTYYIEEVLTFPAWDEQKKHIERFCERNTPITVYLYNQKNISSADMSNYEVVTAWILSLDAHIMEPMSVFYDKRKDQYYLSISIYEGYRKRYGLPYIRLEALDRGTFSEFFLRPESELKMYGYSVNKADGLTEQQRQSKLAQLIDTGLITKAKIISHLDLLIKLQQGREQMQDACKAWEDDRRFVLSYKMKKQRNVWATNFEPHSR